MRVTRRAAASLLAAPLILNAHGAAAQGAAPPVIGPTFHRFRVGALTVTVVTDGSNIRGDVRRGLVVNASGEQVSAAMLAAGLPGTAMRNPYNVTFVETPHLNGQYTVWGQVVEGMEYVDQIAKGEPPQNPDKIVHMRVAADVKD